MNRLCRCPRLTSPEWAEEVNLLQGVALFCWRGAWYCIWTFSHCKSRMVGITLKHRYESSWVECSQVRSGPAILQRRYQYTVWNSWSQKIVVKPVNSNSESIKHDFKSDDSIKDAGLPVIYVLLDATDNYLGQEWRIVSQGMPSPEHQHGPLPEQQLQSARQRHKEILYTKSNFWIDVGVRCIRV